MKNLLLMTERLHRISSTLLVSKVKKWLAFDGRKKLNTKLKPTRSFRNLMLSELRCLEAKPANCKTSHNDCCASQLKIEGFDRRSIRSLGDTADQLLFNELLNVTAHQSCSVFIETRQKRGSNWQSRKFLNSELIELFPDALLPKTWKRS